MITESNVIDHDDTPPIEKSIDDLTATPEEEAIIIATPKAVVAGGKYDKPKIDVPGKDSSAPELKTTGKPKKKATKPKKDKPHTVIFSEISEHEIEHLIHLKAGENDIVFITKTNLEHPELLKKALENKQFKSLADLQFPLDVGCLIDEISILIDQPLEK